MKFYTWIIIYYYKYYNTEDLNEYSRARVFIKRRKITMLTAWWARRDWERPARVVIRDIVALLLKPPWIVARRGAVGKGELTVAQGWEWEWDRVNKSNTQWTSVLAVVERARLNTNDQTPHATARISFPSHRSLISSGGMRGLLRLTKDRPQLPLNSSI